MFTVPSAWPRKGTKRSLLALAFTLVAVLQAAPAWAQGAPTPAPGKSLWTEDFSSGQATPPASVPGGTALDLYHYTDADGVLYTSDADWRATANECNGWILNSGTTIPSTDTGCGNAGGTSRAANNTTAISWLFLQAMADALGVYQGMSTGENNVLASMTNPGPGARTTMPNTMQIQADSVVTTASANPVIEGHYYIASAYFAEVHCSRDRSPYQPAGAGWTDAQEKLELLDSATSTTLISFTASPCAAAPAPTSTTDPIFTPTPPAPYVYMGFRNTPIYVVMGTSNAWQATTGVTDLGIRVSNAQTSTTGNDVAIDNLQILDVTPQLSESFSATSVPAGGTTTLTFTITNTDEFLAKPGWSFDEELPSGLTIVSGPDVICQGTSTAAATAITATGFTITGSLDAGIANDSCTVSVVVTSATAGPYTNDADPANGDNVTAMKGLWKPSPTQVTFTAVMPATPASAVPTGPALPWLLLLMLAATAWYALAKRRR